MGCFTVCGLIWTVLFAFQQTTLCECSLTDRVGDVQNAMDKLEGMIDRMDMAMQEMHIYLDEYRPWSACSATCGIGYKERRKVDCRTYDDGDCKEIMYCNAQPCVSEPRPKITKYATCAMRPNEAPGTEENVRGVIKLSQEEKGPIFITINVAGFDPQPQGANESLLEHGFHVHEYGDISEGCGSAGGHFNPGNNLHGDIWDRERHVGDLGNIRQLPEGVLIQTVVDYRGSLFNGDNNIIGRALVIHRDQDDLGRGGDQGSLTTGNAGPRLACCIIGVANGN